MKIKILRIHFYKHEVELLNLITFVILIINGIDYFNQTLNFYRLFWSSVCLAATIFIDCCQQNVFNQLVQKKVATTIIGIIIVIGLIIIAGLFL